MAERRQVIFKTPEGGVILTANEYPEGLMLTNLEGWDDVEKTIDTVPAWNNGSYITNRRFEDRNYLFTFDNIDSNLREKQLDLFSRMVNSQVITVERIFYNDATEIRKEVITGEITSVNGVERNEDYQTLKVNIYSKNPFKTIYLNGSSISESGIFI